MKFEEVLKKDERNYKIEKEILTNFSNILRSSISINNIQDTLEKNGFNGVYILEPERILLLGQKVDFIGLYDKISKVIILNKNEYLNDNKVGVHEMGHAYLDGRSESNIIYCDRELSYGKGLEEGAVTLLSCASNVKEIDKVDPFVYAYQTRLFQQLDVLYKYSEFKNYDNLLIHLFVEPKRFIPLIKDIYENLYKKSYLDYDRSIILTSAFAMIVGNDLLIDCDDREVYKLLNYINAIYLSVVDKDVRMGIKNNPLFPNVNHFKETTEEVFLEKIFGFSDGFFQRQLSNLNSTMVLLNERLEQYDEEGKIKIKN